MAHAYIPVSATLMGTLSILRDDGKRSEMSLYRGYASKGYRSDYTSIETWWLDLRTPERKARFSMTPGKAKKHIDAVLVDFSKLQKSSTVLEVTGVYQEVPA